MVILSSPGFQAEKNTRLIPCNSGCISIGRSPRQGDDSQQICFEWDQKLSKNHVMLSREYGTIFLEDSKSKNGTFIDGQQVQPQKKYPIKTGSLIRTGETLWTVIEPGYTFLRWLNTVIFLEVSTCINFARAFCGRDMIGKGKVINLTDQRSNAFIVHIECGDGLANTEVAIPALLPRGSRETLVSNCCFNLPKLRSLTSPATETLRFEIEGLQIQSNVNSIEVSGCWDMVIDAGPTTGTSSIDISAVSLVPLGQSSIRKFISSVEQNAHIEDSSFISFEEEKMSAPDNVEKTITERLYHFLANRGQVQYLEPEIKRTPSLKFSCQSIRPVHQLFANETEWKGAGTCFDLVLFFAACLETIGLDPVLLFLGDESGRLSHAVLGVWINGSSGNAAYTCGIRKCEDEQKERAWLSMIQKLERNHFFCVETTGVSRRRNGSSSMSFENAVLSAKNIVKASNQIVALDVHSLRKAPYSIRPAPEFFRS